MPSMSRSLYRRFLDVIYHARQHRGVPDMPDGTMYPANVDKLPGDRLHVSTRNPVVGAAWGLSRRDLHGGERDHCLGRDAIPLG
jgi:hypothetical protein